MEMFFKLMILIGMAVEGHLQDVTEVTAKIDFSDITDCVSNRDSNCTLWCSLDDPQYQCDQITFSHYTYDSSVNYTFSNDEGVDCTYDGANTSTISIELTVVYTGIYACKFGLAMPILGETYHHFDFSQGNGVGIGEACNVDYDCFAEYAYCDTNATGTAQKTCNCHGAYNVTYNDNVDTPACVKPSSFDGNCQTDSQCRVTSNMVCLNGKCDCADGYGKNEETITCDSYGLSAGAIAGIVIGSLAGVALIFGVLWLTYTGRLGSSGNATRG